MGYLQIERSKSGLAWNLRIDGKHVHGVMPESREDLIHWVLWRSLPGRIPTEFVAPIAMQSIADSVRRIRATTPEGGGR